jgi:hypothetical protein
LQRRQRLQYLMARSGQYLITGREQVEVDGPAAVTQAQGERGAAGKVEARRKGAVADRCQHLAHRRRDSLPMGRS